MQHQSFFRNLSSLIIYLVDCSFGRQLTNDSGVQINDREMKSLSMHLYLCIGGLHRLRFFFPEFSFWNESPYFKESFYHLTFDSICGSSDKLFKVAFDKTSVWTIWSSMSARWYLMQ